jgi:RAMP superfamily
MALERGVLVVMPSKDGNPPAFKVYVGNNDYRFPSREEMSQSLLDGLPNRNGQEVEFERVKKQLIKVREVDGKFIAPSAAAVPASTIGRVRGPSATQPTQPPAAKTRADFHNPYNFVPAPPRNLSDPEFGDRRPPAQDTFEADRYTGNVRVRMVVETPLLVPADGEGRQGHVTYPLRVGCDGKPLIPASSIRGMLRSAYEAVTNSRFGCFSRQQHKDRLALRMDAKDGLRLIPARIDGDEIHLLTGTSTIGTDGKRNGPMYAAWLPRYDGGTVSATSAVRYADGELPSHGDEVVCWVEKIRHSKPDFVFWRVREIRRGTDIGQLGPYLPT